MQTQNPSDRSLTLTAAQLKWAQTLHQTVNGGIEPGIPQSKDTSGNWSTFEKANTSGVLIRVSPRGTSDNTYSWAAVGAPITINHGLQRQPIGAHLVSSDKDLRIWIPATPTKDTIQIAPSDNTSYATIYIF